jgi:hypothetical protein
LNSWKKIQVNIIYLNLKKRYFRLLENPRKLTPFRQNKLTPFGHFKLTP